ncbi:hypothetical protein CRYUN_Cryun38cG0003900 [Craigia yunnanensis]
MVQNFMEENNEKQQSVAVRCSRNRCNCFNHNCIDSSEDEMDECCGEGAVCLDGSPPAYCFDKGFDTRVNNCYLELAIFPCWHFLTEQPAESLQRLVMMTIGIADPLATAYCRLYIAHHAQKLPLYDTGSWATSLWASSILYLTMGTCKLDLLTAYCLKCQTSCFLFEVKNLSFHVRHASWIRHKFSYTGPGGDMATDNLTEHQARLHAAAAAASIYINI